MIDRQTYLKPLASLQFFAVVVVVLVHLWTKDLLFFGNACVSFCFAYSGYFTARHHRFDGTYGMKDHLRFMWSKLAKIYPLHVLALIICILSAYRMGHIDSINFKMLAAHLTLTSPWFPYQSYYFGYNTVAWFICVLFFLYIVAPVVVRFWRRLPLAWQPVLLALLLAVEFVGGYTTDGGNQGLFLNSYHLCQFPPIRLLEFSAGIIIFNFSQSAWWREHQSRLTPRRATFIEVGAIVLTALLYPLCKNYLNTYCFRAFCASFPMVITMLGVFLFTNGQGGAVSRALSVKPLTCLSTLDAEIYLLQLGLYFALLPAFESCGITQYPILHFTMQFSSLIFISWLVHRYYTQPIARLLTASLPGKGK